MKSDPSRSRDAGSQSDKPKAYRGSATEVPPYKDAPGYPKRPLFHAASTRRYPSFPFLGLFIFCLITGALAALGWYIWEIFEPMLEAPEAPQFEQAVKPPPFPTPLALEPATDSNQALEPGSKGQVIEPIGLALRSQPNTNGAYMGGIVLGEVVTLLETSGDGQWQRVRRDLNGQEGWVKAGNLETLSQDTVATTSGLSSFPTSRRGRVRVSIGLVLRSQPSSASAQAGGIPFNEVVGIIEDSADGRWQHVRRANGQQGWIKAGNLGPE